MIHGTLVLTVLQHGDLDRVRLAHHGAVHGFAARARVAAFDVQVEGVRHVHALRGRHAGGVELVLDVGDPAGRRRRRRSARGESRTLASHKFEMLASPCAKLYWISPRTRAMASSFFSLIAEEWSAHSIVVCISAVIVIAGS